MTQKAAMVRAVARADLQTAARRLRRLEELIEDQRRRVAAYRANGHAKAAEHADELLRVLEESQETTRHVITLRRRSLGVED